MIAFFNEQIEKLKNAKLKAEEEKQDTKDFDDLINIHLNLLKWYNNN